MKLSYFKCVQQKLNYQRYFSEFCNDEQIFELLAAVNDKQT